MMTSPSGTGRLLGCHVVICVGSSSSRCDGDVACLALGSARTPGSSTWRPPRFGPPRRRSPVHRDADRKSSPAPPGRDVGHPVVRRDWVETYWPRPPDRRSSTRAPIGRRAPGGRDRSARGTHRRPGGGGMGRPVELRGGRVDGHRPRRPLRDRTLRRANRRRPTR